jgi:signal transduction histidine kinase
MKLAPDRNIGRRCGVTTWLLIGLILFGWRESQATLLLYEGFNYPAGEELGELGSAQAWANDKSQLRIVKGSLDYPELAASTGNRVNFEATTPNLDSVRTVDGSWMKQSGGALYISFILRLQSAAQISSTNEGTSLVTISDTFNNTQLLGINLLNNGADGTLRLGVIKYPSGNTSISSYAFFTNDVGAALSVDGATTYLVVAKYRWSEGATNDEVALWVNPESLGNSEDPLHKISTSAGRDGTGGAGRLTLSRGPNVNLDELRLGQTWADVTPRVLPPKHWLVTVGLLAAGLVAAILWITRLRRKVRERSAALRAQIQQRQQAEHQRLMEQERARIAQDLHDELGADITEISMLATRAKGGANGDEETRLFLEQLTDKTRQMVAKLEEIVWAMDPQHDSLGALVSYLAFFADRFLGLANIRLNITTSDDVASLGVEARVRHQLFLAFKETLANVVKHSGAKEVRLDVRVENAALCVEVADDGSGLGEPDPTSGVHEGLANMRRRMEKLGGQFTITTEIGRGTTVKFSVPLNK